MTFISDYFGLLLLIVLLIASVVDLRLRRIPNWLTMSMALLSLVLHGLVNGWTGIIFCLQGLGLGLGCLLLPYLLGGMGAGDVKLMGAVGATLGFQHTFVAFLFVAMAGGVMAVGMMLSRRALKQTLTGIAAKLTFLITHGDVSLLKVEKDTLRGQGMPYGVAITGGVLFYMLYAWQTTGQIPGAIPH